MDFVVVGFGLGALGVLLGVVMLGWLAPRSLRAAARVSSPDAAARGRAVAAEHRGTGQALVYAGGAMLLATVAGLVGSLDDRTGAFLVTTTATVSAVGILLGGYLQRVRHPTPPRHRAHSAPAASVSREEAVNVEEMTPLSPAVSDAFASGATDSAPLGDSPVVVETTDSGSWQLDDRAAGNGSGDTDLAEREDHQAVGQVAPSTHLTEATPSRPDDEDPPSGHS